MSFPTEKRGISHHIFRDLLTYFEKSNRFMSYEKNSGINISTSSLNISTCQKYITNVNIHIGTPSSSFSLYHHFSAVYGASILPIVYVNVLEVTLKLSPSHIAANVEGPGPCTALAHIKYSINICWRNNWSHLRFL